MRASSKAVVLFPLIVTACGAGAGSDYSRSYATLHGAIASSSVQTTSDVRVALVWEVVDPQPGTTSLKSTQELGLQAQFPAKFQMEINSLPPHESLSNNLAAGTLVVYEDLNHNGQLDLLPLDAKSTIDRVLGVPQGLTVVYVEGTPPAKAARGYFASVALTPGFNLLQEPGWGQAPGAISGQPVAAAPGAATPWVLLPLSTEIPIALGDSPQLSQYVCQKDPGLISTCASTPPSDPSTPSIGAGTNGVDNCAPPMATMPPSPVGADAPGLAPPANGAQGTNSTCEAAATSPCGQAQCNVNGAGAATAGPPDTGAGTATPPPGNGSGSGTGTGDGAPPCCKK